MKNVMIITEIYANGDKITRWLKGATLIYWALDSEFSVSVETKTNFDCQPSYILYSIKESTD